MTQDDHPTLNVLMSVYEVIQKLFGESARHPTEDEDDERAVKEEEWGWEHLKWITRRVKRITLLLLLPQPPTA